MSSKDTALSSPGTIESVEPTIESAAAAPSVRRRIRPSHWLAAAVLCLIGLAIPLSVPQPADAAGPPPFGELPITQCESNYWLPNYCTLAGKSLRGVIVFRQLSNQQCIYGVNWWYTPTTIVVNNGCRAVFGYSETHYLTTKQCSSWGYGYNSCDSNFRRTVEYSKRRYQYSSSECREGSSWGQTGTGIWVSDGCRADFVLWHP